MWLQEKVSGISGWQALAAPAGPQVAGRIGGAIAKLHRVLPPLPRKHSIADEIAGLHKALDGIGKLRPEWDRRLRAVGRACERLAATATQTCVSGVHRDFYHDQVIVDGDRIWLLDLDLAAEGDPAVDAGNFIAHLAEQSLRMHGNPDALAAEEEAFVSGFRRAGGEADRENIEIYKTLSLARHIYLSATFESRRQYTSALLTLCENRLGL
jgi:aminoglycoside phosphotransferase (APT) family kinase protein